MSIEAYAEVERHFLGFAQVNINHLEFDSGRALDNRNVDRLLGIFRLEEEGCRRDDPANAVPVVLQGRALVDTASASHPYSQTAIQAQTLSLAPTVKLLCLHGEHRICAARKFLPASDRWWTVRVFDAGLPSHARDRLRYEFSNSLKFTDGEIFRHHVDAEARHNSRSANEWLARLPPRKQRTVRELKTFDGGKYLAALKPLVPFVRLWDDFILPTRALSMKCREEIYRYLEAIKDIWHDILGSDVEPHHLDVQTVRMFNVLMPFYSSQDVETIDNAINSLNAFRHVRDRATRQRLAARAARHKRILTLDSFRADTIFLETCYNPLSKLFSIKERTLQESCKFSFKHAPELFRVSYIGLWLHSMRNYKYLSNLPSAQPKRDKGQDIKEPCLKSGAKFAELALYASSQGFENDQITEQLAKSPRQICQESMRADLPEFSSDRDGLPKHLRCNRSSNSMFEKDREYLSLKNIYHNYMGPRKQSATSFAVLSDIVHCFFGGITANEPASECEETFDGNRPPVPTETMALSSQGNVVQPSPSGCEGPSCLSSSISATRLQPSHQDCEDEMDFIPEVPAGASSPALEEVVEFQSKPLAQREDERKGQRGGLHHKTFKVTKPPQNSKLRSAQLSGKTGATQPQKVREAYLRAIQDEAPTGLVGKPPNEPVVNAESQQEQINLQHSLPEGEKSRDAPDQTERLCISPEWKEYEQPISQAEETFQQSDVQARSAPSPSEEEEMRPSKYPEGEGLPAGQNDPPTSRNSNEVIPLGDTSTDKGSLESLSESEHLEGLGENRQSVQEQSLPNSTTEQNDSAVTTKGDLGQSTHKTRVTHQQVHDEAMQRRDKKRRHRSRILPKLTGQREAPETAGTDTHHHVGGESQSQAQLHDAQQQYGDEEIGEEIETLSQQRQEADDYMRSAAEAVEEVYDEDTDTESIGNILQRETAGVSENQPTPEVGEHRKRISEFPGGDLGMRFNVAPDADRSDIGENSSERPKRKAIRDASELISSGHHSPSQENPTDAIDQNTNTADPQPDPRANRPTTLFPGQTSNLRLFQSNTADSKSSEGPDQPDTYHASYSMSKDDDQIGSDIRAQIAELPKRTNRSDEERGYTPERSTTQQPPAQFNDWESMKDLVTSVERIWHLLDHTRIHITSTEKIEELESKLDSNHERLWSWCRNEKDQFESQIGFLLSKKGFRLQVVSRNRDSLPRNYSTVSEMGYWVSHYDFNEPIYWLAILFREAEDGRPWTKVRRMVERSNVA